MLANTKTVLEDIVWEDGFIGPKTTWLKVPDYLAGWNDSTMLRMFIRGWLQGTYGGYAYNFRIKEVDSGH